MRILGNILDTHWYLLQEDPILRKYVNTYPEIVFRRTNSLRDKLVFSHYTAYKPYAPKLPLGTSRCGNCTFCPWVLPGHQVLLPNGEVYYPKFSTTCNRQGVIYLMTCRCGAFYVGKTARQLRQRINDHLYYSGNGKMLTPISRHLDFYHRFDTTSVSFTALAVVPKNPRGDEWGKFILQKETLWIERLNATRAPAPYKPFL